jgi:hypothetical protein
VARLAAAFGHFYLRCNSLFRHERIPKSERATKYRSCEQHCKRAS